VVVDGQQFNGGDVEALQVFDGRFVGEAGVGAAEFLGHAGHPLGETLDVQLVNEGLVPGGARRVVVSPRERRVEHHAERGERGAIAVVE
jgi:hypothetical protein